jgi:hypothetical protein
VELIAILVIYEKAQNTMGIDFRIKNLKVTKISSIYGRTNSD